MKNSLKTIETISNSVKECGIVYTLHYCFEKNIKVSLAFCNSDCNLNIDILNLSVRSYNALMRSEISTIGQLIDGMNQGNIRSIRNLGEKSYREIQTKLLVYGFERLSEKEKETFYSQLVEEN